MARKFERNSSKNKRTQNTRTPYRHYLIYCGGETEKYYFEALKKVLRRGIATVDVFSKGIDPLRVVENAKKIASNASPSYDEIWVVFDKDEFKNFAEAIETATQEGMFCAYSNESFELWFVLHFEEVNTSRDRYFLEKRMAELLEKTYSKVNPQNYNLLNEKGNEKQAIERATKLSTKYYDKRYNEHNPSTTVHLLVSKLNTYKMP
jgi:hypothetical protein